jgi:hypothetical protein
MNTLKAFEILTTYFSENKENLTPEQIAAWDYIRNKYVEIVGGLITLSNSVQ